MALTRITDKQVTYKQGASGSVVRGLGDKLRESVSVKDFGAVGDGVTDDTVAIQAAVNTGKSLFYPPGIYSASELYYHWGDSGPDATRIWYGPGAVIKANGPSGTPFLLNIAGQNLRIVGLELQGYGPLDTTYDCLLQFDTRSNAVNLNNIYLDGVTARFNHKTVIYGLATDTTAKVSEIFFNKCTFIQCQKIFDVQGPGMVDLAVADSYLSQAALASANANENYIVKIPNGNVVFDNCHLMATGLNGTASVGWVGYFPDNASNASLTISGGILEAKEGFHWGSDANATLRISNISNGYWGWEYNGEALFALGSNVEGGVYLSNTHLSHSYGHAPLLIDAANSPLFNIRTDDGCKFSSVLNPVVDIFTKISGGKWNFPESEIAIVYGRVSNPITAPNIGSVLYATDWISASHTTHRFKGLYSGGIISVPSEGLKNAWLEVQLGWDQTDSLAYVTRHTSLSCGIFNSDTYAGVITPQDAGGNLFERGIVPGARVFDQAGTLINTISTTDFTNGTFRFSSNYTGTTSTQNLSFEIEIAQVTKGNLQRIYIGDLWPGDKLRLIIKATTATTDTDLSYQKVRLVGGSRAVNLELSGGV